MKIRCNMVALPLVIALSACSSEDSGAANACNDLVNNAPAVTLVAIADSPPAALGGTLVDGTYWLTGFNVFTGPGGTTDLSTFTANATFVLSGTTMQQVLSSNGGAEKRYTSTVSTSGTTLYATDTCPEPVTEQDPYTATPTKLTIYLDDPNGTFEQIYTKQ